MHFTGAFIPACVAKPAEVSSLACPSSVEGIVSPASGARRFGCALQSISPGWCKPRAIYHLGAWWMRWYELVALVHYCWNQLISLLAASAESLGKAPCALWHLSLFGRSCRPSVGTVSNQPIDPGDFVALIFWSPSLLCRGLVDAPDGLLRGPEAGSRMTDCPGPPGRWCSYFPAWDLHVCLAAGLQQRGICICECGVFSSPDPTASSARNCCVSHTVQGRLARLCSSPGACQGLALQVS